MGLPLVQSYRDLIVWQKSVALSATVYSLLPALPREERFGIAPQLRRAVVSISSNIAEGHGSSQRGVFLRHLAIARGSLMEVESLLHTVRILHGLDPKRLEPSLVAIDEISRMLTRLMRALRESRTLDPAKQKRRPL